MPLAVTLQEYLRRTSVLHPKLCPRQVLGVRMARFACQYLEIDPEGQRKRIFVLMEIGHCVADGVTIVTGASPTNDLMQLVDYGKVAATFVDLHTHMAIRVCEHPGSRQTALEFSPDAPSAWLAQLQAYQIMPDECLLKWEGVKVNAPLAKANEKTAVICCCCGETVYNHAHVLFDETPVCKACVGSAYYQKLG